MRIDITARHLELTEALRAYATEKLARLQRHNDLVQEASVVLGADGARRVAEVIARPKVGGPLVARAEHDDLYAAIDLLVDKIDRQLGRHKERVKVDRNRHGATPRLGEALAGAEAAAATELEEEGRERTAGA
ncbi:MAG: hypothetical protein KatS3mg102_2430 [Planctomycetota bacterium]|nr:MAG: hypothetical protein KatS3mg102_2430 [Planctomycetota bacterium]